MDPGIPIGDRAVYRRLHLGEVLRIARMHRPYRLRLINPGGIRNSEDRPAVRARRRHHRGRGIRGGQRGQQQFVGLRPADRVVFDLQRGGFELRDLRNIARR